LDPAVVGRGVDGVSTTWNTGAERLYGYSAEEMIGQRFEIIVPSARRRWEAEAVKASLLARLSDTYDTDRPELACRAVVGDTPHDESRHEARHVV
jgi:two-component system CheB/CheR fusion protein